MEGLETLEYRGYDSWGLVSVRGDSLDRLRGVGSVSRAHQTGIFGDGPQSNLAPANVALGHTRWATHGGVSEKNAHPHLSFDGRVAIVHNGVIENYLSLRRELENEGIQLSSETDSEVIAHLIAKAIPAAASITAAIATVMHRLEGEYGSSVSRSMIRTPYMRSSTRARCSSQSDRKTPSSPQTSWRPSPSAAR